MKNKHMPFFLTLVITLAIFTCGCTDTLEQQTTTSTLSQTIRPVTTTLQITATEPKALAQKGLGNNSIRNRGFYRDDEFIIIGVLQNPYSYPVSVAVDYSLYNELNYSIASGRVQSGNGDIVNGYLPAKGVLPVKVNCGKVPNVAKYSLNLDLQKTTQKPREKFKENSISAQIDGSTVTIVGEVENQGQNKTTKTRLIAMLYDVNDKAIDALSAYTLPIEVNPNSTASFTIEQVYPKTYAAYLQKIDHYRLFIQNVYEYSPNQENKNASNTKIPIEFTGTNNTEIKLI